MLSKTLLQMPGIRLGSPSLEALPVAGCVVFDQQHRILLVRRNTTEDFRWEIPGGKVEPGESPSDAAVREMHEELGLSVQIVRELGQQLFREKDRLIRYHWFGAMIVHGRPTAREPAHDSVRFLDLGDVTQNSYRLSAGVRAFLETH